MTTVKQIRIISLVTALVTIFMVGLGGYVRATGAGLACPDWPLCFGKLVPELKVGVFQEVFHRYTAIIISLGIAALAYLGFKNKQELPQLFSTTKFLLILLFVQIIFGGLTVLMQLNSLIVTAHLFLGTILLQVLLLMAVEKDKAVEGDTRGEGLLVILSALVLFQIVLGGFVGTSGASLACPDIPLCFGALIPENATGQQIIHMLHRLNGGVILVFAVLSVIKFDRTTAVKRGHMIGMLVAIIIQIGMGFSNVTRGIPIPETVAHLVLAQLILFGYLAPLKKLKGIKIYASQ